jgi:ADP-heptose:LPS heptosyltransferase
LATHKKVLIYRLGSIGDTVISIPSLDLIRNSFPDSHIKLLTNYPVNHRTSAAESVLADSNFIDSYEYYPLGTRDPKKILALIKKLRLWSPSIVFYLASFRSKLKVIRDLFFFRLICKNVSGIPLSISHQAHNQLSDNPIFFEQEGSRLYRNISDSQTPPVPTYGKSYKRIPISHQRRMKTKKILSELSSRPPIICGFGTKMPAKNWGSENWISLLRKLESNFSDIPLIAVGAKDEFLEIEEILECWTGTKLNLAGKISPLDSVAIAEKSLLYLGHDTGPMHLAAGAGIPCVSIFSSRALPGVWFPFGTENINFYKYVSCKNCQQDLCPLDNMCIKQIRPEDVFSRISDTLKKYY